MNPYLIFLVIKSRSSNEYLFKPLRYHPRINSIDPLIGQFLASWEIGQELGGN